MEPLTVVALVITVFMLLVLVIGAGLLYVTAVHPSLATPLTVAVGGVALVFTVVGVMTALFAMRR